ncbi:hypothetical protein MMC08_004489, partial [Hypocenomyce scalaris]|nr:hypothetical protein [Hypocenomyce scalaris]
IITSEDIERISQALHPFRIPLGGESCGDQNSNGNGQGLLNNSTIDANITFNTRTFRYASLRQNIHAKKLAKAQGIEAPNTPDNNVLGQEDSQIVETLGRLNITVVTAGASCSERKTLLSKLCDAIHNDLLIVENEDRDTMKRMAGYWRYVNKRTYNAMVRNNELWNWATGAKLEEIEEIEEFNEEKEAERDQEGFADGSGAHEVEVHSQDILVERYDTDFSFRDAEGLPLVLREPAEDKKGAAEGQFDGKPDTRHLTSINHRASYYPEPVSANPLNQTGKAGKQIVDGGEEDAFVAEDEEHQYYNEHYDYEYGEDVNYYIAHSTKYKNSAPLFRHSRSKAKNVGERFSKLATAKVTALKAPTPKSTTPKVTTPKVTIPKAKILKITIPKVKTTKAKSPRAKSSKAKGTPTANRDGPSYAAVLRHGLKEP